MTTGTVSSDEEALLEEVEARLDLRDPNKQAVRTLAITLHWHEDVQGRTEPFEGVIDAATGVGKTYILAAAMEYFAAQGTRNFAVIAPGKTILEKTVDQFTAGHPKSLLGGMDIEPVLITARNFNSPAMRAAMDNPEQIKLYVFTVQALTSPERNPEGRKTRKFQEGLGRDFYSHLDDRDDLIVFADEHHCYYGPSFSSAVRDLTPRAIVGLTATPHKKTKPEEIIYRYPLAAAIADKLVKTPVIVGRKDDLTDDLTKLRDGARLLDAKQQALDTYCKQEGKQPINAVMLVLAQSIAEAEQVERIVKDSSFAEGRFADHVLTVTSKSPDEDLKRLEEVEDPASGVRILISVNKLKEGWDVKNVYVIASLRALVSDMLSEQTLGRGLRLPFGSYTGWELLDTLEVLAHERYRELLKKAGVINQGFVDHRTVIEKRRNAQGEEVEVPTDVPVDVGVDELPIFVNPGPEPDGPGGVAGAGAGTGGSLGSGGGGVRVGATEDRQKQVEAEVAAAIELRPREDLPALEIPRLVMTAVESSFHLSDITDLTPFRELGRRLALNPSDELRRERIGAQIIGKGDARKTQLVTSATADRMRSAAEQVPLAESRQALIERIRSASVVEARAGQGQAAARLTDAFIEGMGSDAETTLSSYLARAGDRLVDLVTEEHRRFLAKPSYEEVVELARLAPTRIGRTEQSTDRYGQFKKATGYTGWQRSMYEQVWFDSSTERELANALDSEEAISFWVRLHTKDLPILWQTVRDYNPDFIAVETAGEHWVIEVKADKDMTSDAVQGKREAALRWANHVTDSAETDVVRRYLLVSETDIEEARGSWPALKRAGGY